MGRMESQRGSQTYHWFSSFPKTRPRKRTNITISEETLQLILTSALDIGIRGGCDGIREVLLVLAVLQLGFHLHQDAVGSKLDNTQVQRLELLLDGSGVIASLLQVLGAHDREQIVVRLAIDVLLSTTELVDTLLDVVLQLFAIGHREEQAVQRRLRLTLVHGLGHLRSRKILLRDIASRTNPVRLVGFLVTLDLANIRNTSCVFGRILDGSLREKIRKGLHAYPKSRLKHGLAADV